MTTAGFDLDGVIGLLPFGLEQVMLTSQNEKIFRWLQQFKLFRCLYNFFFRRVNPEIKELMKELKERGFEVIIISASDVDYQKELERWLMKKGVCFDRLYLKGTSENCLDYKKRVVPRFCHYYWDDKKEIVDYLNSQSNNGKCQVFLYQPKTKKEELLKKIS